MAAFFKMKNSTRKIYYLKISKYKTVSRGLQTFQEFLKVKVT